MKKIFLFVWQLPQNILGLLVILFTRAKNTGKGFWYTNKKIKFGVSLGNFIIFSCDYGLGPGDTSIKHEQGHQVQSIFSGWLYLILIGIPSFCGNVFDRIFHKDWDVIKRLRWYYSLPWEKSADNRGKVKRSYMK